MGQYAAGIQLWGVRTDVANSTPYMFGAAQEVSFDISGSLKELFGQNKFPVAVLPTTMKVTGKLKNAQIQSAIWNDFLLGGTRTNPAQLKVAAEEATGVIPATPWRLTVANSATWVDDLGVIKLSVNGDRVVLRKSGTTPNAGQYLAVGSGVYEFNVAEQGFNVLISYTYTVTSSGNKILVANSVMGSAPIFQLVYSCLFNAQQANFKWHACTANKLSFATKNDDWMIPELDFACFADSSDQLVTISTVG